MTDQNPNAYPPAPPAAYTPYPTQKSGTNVLAISPSSARSSSPSPA